MNITVKQFEEDNRDLINYWLDHAHYKPVSNVEDIIPKKIDATRPRSRRRFALLHHSLRLLKHIDLTNNKRVIDIGAGFGDFTLLAKYYNFEQLDATDPGIDQYKFLTTYMQDYYDNIYNLGIEDVNLQGYDTAILSGMWFPNYRVALEKYIFGTDIRTIIIGDRFEKSKRFTEQVHFKTTYAAPWKYNNDASRYLIGKNFLDMIMRSNGFAATSSFELQSQQNYNKYIYNKYILQYTRK